MFSIVRHCRVLIVLLFIRIDSSNCRSSCQTSTLCRFDSTSSHLICDQTSSSDQSPTPNLSCFPPGTRYTFRHFQRLSPLIFETIRFASNASIFIEIFNVSLIESETFSRRLSIPTGSKLFIEIENSNNSSSLTIQPNAFDQLEISLLRFVNLNNFNGRSTFDTSAFGVTLDVENLIFDRCAISGFNNVERKAADVKHLSIVESSMLTQLTEKSLPSFVDQLISLTIENTSLKLINSHTFKAWTMSLEQFHLINNQKLETLKSNMIDGVFMKLKRLDLTGNPNRMFNDDFDWFPFNNAKELILRSTPLDIYLRTNLLLNLSSVEFIDFSQSYLTDKNHSDLIRNAFPNEMSSLLSVNLSYAQINESILIEILTKFSEIIDQPVDVELFGQKLSEENFCSYLKIVKTARNFLQLRLDASHPCNCIVDLFELADCQYCDSTNLTSIYKCQISSPSKNDDGFGSFAFAGLFVGLSIFLLLVLLGAAWIYRQRRQKRFDLDMEDPIENPLTAVIQQRVKRH